MALESLSNVKLALGIDTDEKDGLLAQLQGAADGYIETHCRRSFQGGTFTEFHPGGGALVFLRNFPVATVSQVRVDEEREFGDETVYPSTGYIVHADRGVIECKDYSFVPRMPGWDPRMAAYAGAVRVTYTTSADQVPPGIARASVELIGHWFRQAETAAATGHKNVVQDGTIVYPWAQSTGFRLLPAIETLLEDFRVPTM